MLLLEEHIIIICKFANSVHSFYEDAVLTTGILLLSSQYSKDNRVMTYLMESSWILIQKDR
jgi:hypothetical protein